MTSEIIRDCAVYTTKAVTIVEIMGRDAGWLTASSALGRAAGLSGPDFVYLPERAFNMESFFSDIEEAFSRHPNVVVTVSEGVRFADGRYVGEGAQSGSADAFGHKYLAGAGKVLERAVKEKFGCKVRSVELNLPQRCAGHLLSKTDISEAVSIGREAVRCASDGLSCEMMVFERKPGEKYKVETGHKKVSEIANKIRKVPGEFINEKGNDVTDTCLQYMIPLIEGECDIKYHKGIPMHFVF